MRSSLVAASLLIAFAAIVGGCAQKRTQPVAQSAPPAAPAPAEPPEVREKQPRFGDSAVYIDGKPVGVVRLGELPAGLKGKTYDLGSGYTQTHYGFVDYVRALGVDRTRIKAMHLYGGRRAVVVDKKELARIGDEITFTFNRGSRGGKPRVHWPHRKIHVNTTIDMLSSVAVYVDKEPPILDKDGELVMPDGSPIEGKVPYAPEEQGNGTRVYVDGDLVGTVKRKKLTDDIMTGDDRFSLLGYAARLRPAAKDAKTVDLLAGDDVVGQLSPEAAKTLAFNVPQHNRGQAVVDLNGTRARVSAVQIYVNQKPPARPVVPVDEAPEAALVQSRGGSGANEEL